MLTFHAVSDTGKSKMKMTIWLYVEWIMSDTTGCWGARFQHPNPKNTWKEYIKAMLKQIRNVIKANKKHNKDKFQEASTIGNIQ